MVTKLQGLPWVGKDKLVVLESRKPKEHGFVFKIVEATFSDEKILCSDKFYGLYGHSIDSEDTRLLEFNDFSNSDKLWLVRGCFYYRMAMSRFILSDHVNYKTITSATPKSVFDMLCIITKLAFDVLDRCMFTMNVAWEELPHIYEEIMSTPGVANLSLVQANKYIKDQFQLQALHESDAPAWFVANSFYERMKKLWFTFERQ